MNQPRSHQSPRAAKNEMWEISRQPCNDHTILQRNWIICAEVVIEWILGCQWWMVTFTQVPYLSTNII